MGGPGNDVIPLVGYHLEFRGIRQPQLTVPLERDNEERDIFSLQPIVQGGHFEIPEMGDAPPDESQALPLELR
jgi:hypothetical protein